MYFGLTQKSHFSPKGLTGFLTEFQKNSPNGLWSLHLPPIKMVHCGISSSEKIALL
jgi:hypothetical protein